VHVIEISTKGNIPEGTILKEVSIAKTKVIHTD